MIVTEKLSANIEAFSESITQAQASLERLLAARDCSYNLSEGMKLGGIQGVYLFSDGDGRPMYVGKGLIEGRYRDHIGGLIGGRADRRNKRTMNKNASLAIWLARLETGRTDIGGKDRWNDLLLDTAFSDEYARQIGVIRDMEFRWVEERHVHQRVLLEFYCTQVLEPHYTPEPY